MRLGQTRMKAIISTRSTLSMTTRMLLSGLAARAMDMQAHVLLIGTMKMPIAKAPDRVVDSV